MFLVITMKTFQFQHKKNQNYFEGWYIRLIDSKHQINIAVIFAISYAEQHPHSFIQVYNGTDKQAHYYTFGVDEFHFDADTYTVQIGENYLSPTSLVLNIDEYKLQAEVSHRILLEQYQSTYSPMGRLSKAPLECFQEVIYLNGSVSFTLNGTEYDGTSYMEKTYGTNFPTKWIWIESSTSEKGSLLSFSVGIVPVLFLKIKGFFLIYRHNNKEHRFGSFNLSRIKVLDYTDYHTTIQIKKGRTRIVLKAQTNHPIKLIGPRKNGVMDLAVFESLDSTATIHVYHGKKLIFDDSYTNVGLELMY